jgi:hypothetical protein
VAGVLKKGIKKQRTSRMQFIKFATAVILQDKFKCQKVYEKKAKQRDELCTQTLQKTS